MAVSAGRIESPTPYDHLTTEKGVSKDRVFALDIAQLKDTLADQCKEDEPTRNAVLKWFPWTTKRVRWSHEIYSCSRFKMLCLPCFVTVPIPLLMMFAGLISLLAPGKI